MENIYILAIGCGLVFGALLGRFITKLKLAMVYESRLRKKRAGIQTNVVEVKGG